MADESHRDRAERYLRMATETASQAQRAGDPDVAEAYLQLASVWLRMADEITVRTPANEEADDAPSGERGDEAQASG